jgi:hypothetical protein
MLGWQKIVSDVATGMRRIYEYCYPLEDARARRARALTGATLCRTASPPDGLDARDSAVTAGTPITPQGQGVRRHHRGPKG